MIARVSGLSGTATLASKRVLSAKKRIKCNNSIYKSVLEVGFKTKADRIRFATFARTPVA